jgi:hypothetical protein
MLGDNAYNDGTDSEYQAAVFDTYPEILRQVALWPTLGNHDGYTADSDTQSGPYYDIFTLPTNGEAGGLASGTEAYYSFDYANIHFICLESYETDRSTGGAMLTWLESDLSENDKPWVIAFWHHPPYTKGSHDSDTEGNLKDMRENALPILDAWGVDLVLGGHSHSYERSYLLDGHYGTSGTLDASMIRDGGDGREGGDGAYEKSGTVPVTNEGAVYAVAGSSGKISGGSLNHPAMYVSMNTLGSMVLDVAGNRLDAIFLDSDGAVGDSFSITKGPDTTPPALVSAEAVDDITVALQFSETIDQVGAETAVNYAIDQGITVSAATLAADGRSVNLSTSVLSEGVTYTVTVDNLTDLAGNPIAAGSQAHFEFFTLVTKSFKDGVAPTTDYSGTTDTYLSQASPSGKFGGDPELLADGDDPYGSTNDLVTLIAWDISVIPADALVESATIDINVLNPSNGSYGLYQALRDWSEDEATWNQASNGASWQSGGASGSSDRDTLVLGAVSASSTGSYSLNLNDEGLAVLQGWIDGSISNYGFVLADSETTDGLDFDSSESSAVNRPELTIIYSVPPTSSDTEAPQSPGNLTEAGVTATTVTLDWDAATDNVGVVGYKIYRDGQLIATESATSFEDSGLRAGTSYIYTVTSYDAANNESVPAGPLVVVTEPVPLTHVQDISLQLVDGGATHHATSQITVLDGTAQPVVDATVQAVWSGLVSGTVSGITLADGTVSFASDDVPSAVFGQLSFAVTDVSASGYLYDEAGNSETSDCITTIGTDCHSVPGAPAAPTGLIALGALSAIDLDWDDSADPSVTGYTVYRSTTSGSGYQPLVSVASSAYTDGMVSAGVPYYYAVVAYYSSGAPSPFSGEAWAVAGETTLSFQDGVSPVAIYAGTRDTYIAQANPSTNSGSDVDLLADGDDPPSSGNDLSSLLAWDLSAIPNGAVIESASIEMKVFNRSTGSYQLYEVKRNWSESQATWNQAASGSDWSQAGALHADDRGSQVLATISASSTGTYSVDLGTDGLAVLQAWVDAERPNNGFILANEDTTDGLDFHSSEAITATDRPKLTLSYVINESPASSPAIEIGTVTGVGSSGWTPVTLPRSYSSMVVIASPSYEEGSAPGVVRIQNATGNGFEVRMDSAGSGALSGVTVHYVVLEEGVYTAAEHGVTMEAVRFDSEVTDRSSSWIGEGRNYAHAYTNPVVIGQVMTYNDPGFSVFWARGSNRQSPPSSTTLYVGKHVAQDSDITRENETLGYLVIEGGQGMVGGLAYAAGVGADSVKGITDSPPYSYAFGGMETVSTALVSSAAMDGNDGGWPVLYGTDPVAVGSLDLAVDEDQIGDSERNHTSEQLAYLVFGTPAPQSDDPYLEQGLVSSVDNGAWVEVELSRTYDSMVVVATPAYDETQPPLVTRIRYADADSFELTVQRADGGAGQVAGVDVHFMVVEQGVYTYAQHGVTMEAVRFDSTQTSHDGDWSAESRGYANAYANPVVLGQVMTYNNTGFSQFWARGSGTGDPPSATGLRVGKHVGEDPATGRADETIGYIVVEAGAGLISGQVYEAGLGADSVQGMTNSPPYTYGINMTAPAAAILSAAGMDGVNGGWPVLYGADPFAANQLNLVYDEDQINDSERAHTTEQVGYILFE